VTTRFCVPIFAVVAAALAGCSVGAATAARPTSPVSAAHRAESSSPSAPRPAATGTHAEPAHPVHASFFEADGHTYGVGMPIIVRFTKPVRDPAPFEHAAIVRLNGTIADGAWYWERSGASGYAVEAHYRLQHFWPAHSRVSVALPIKGVSAGPGRAFDDSLTLDVRIGAAHISTVDASATHPHMTITSDGRKLPTLPVSLGKDSPSTATMRGTKIVEEFDRVQNMEGTPVPWSVRITNSGEFIHAAPWNGEIGRANLSHGCTNLSTEDAKWFYRFSRLGDVVQYPNAPGKVMPVWDGIGDWNVPWPVWQAGGRAGGA
jgi:lipoprotein-anchoring transpeptidase ErfK/SrfK